MARSKNPDLLFPEILTERAGRVSDFYCSRTEGTTLPSLDRVTLFVTHRCNLFCQYCNGPHMGKNIGHEERKSMLNADMGLEQYTSLLEEWAAQGLKHIHFTGGEATLNRRLPEFVKKATEKGIMSSLTTNSTAKPELYRTLVDNGLSEIRISIDSAVDEEFDRITCVKGTSLKVKQNIQELVRQRDEEHKDIYIILNACIGSFNIEGIRSTLDALIQLGPDALKFLVITEEANNVFTKASRQLVNGLLDYARSVRSHDELLERKIKSMFRRDSFGLHGRLREMQQCFIPLTERTLDSRNIYPCSIYLRYRGEPIAPASASFAQQQKAIDSFVEGHDCREDPICIASCTNCCKQYNIDVNRSVQRAKDMAEAEKRGVIIPDKPTDEEARRILELRQSIVLMGHQGSTPFIFIKPPGLGHREEILGYLAGQGIKITGEKTVDDWQELSLLLYMKGASEEKARFRIARNRAFREFEGCNTASYFDVEKEIPEGKLRRLKHDLRRMFPEKLFLFEHNNDKILGRSNCIHVPDYKDLVYERKVIEYFLG